MVYAFVFGFEVDKRVAYSARPDSDEEHPNVRVRKHKQRDKLQDLLAIALSSVLCVSPRKMSTHFNVVPLYGHIASSWVRFKDKHTKAQGFLHTPEYYVKRRVHARTPAAQTTHQNI